MKQKNFKMLQIEKKNFITKRNNDNIEKKM